MKNVMVALLVAGAAGIASAQVVVPGAETSHYVINLDGSIAGGESGAVVNENFDNWRAAAQGGASVLLGNYKTGGNELADDLNMIGVGAGWLDSCGFSVANVDGPTGSALTGGSGTVRFYRQSDGGFIDGFNFNLPTLNLLPTQSSRISFAAGSLSALEIYLPSQIFAAVQYTSLTGTGGFTLANAGQQIRGPINTGTSSDVLYENGAAFNFGGSPAANSAWFIKTNDVPAPASAALLGLAGIAAGRRRR